jgi:tetratricopeptide (TPR) repeat protein
MSRIGSGPRRLFGVMIYLAEAHEAIVNWEEARAIYVTMLKETLNDDPETADAPQNRMIFTGLSRCMYQVGLYDRAIAAGEGALAMNRHFPGVHKLIALPQLALGQVEAARTTMRRGVVYETPWDEENREKNIAFLEECLRDETTYKAGM